MLRACATLCSLLGAGGGVFGGSGCRRTHPNAPLSLPPLPCPPAGPLGRFRNGPLAGALLNPQDMPSRSVTVAMAPAFWSLNITGGTDLLGGGKPPRPDSDVPDGRAIPERAWSAQRRRGPPTPRCLQGGWDPLCTLRPSLGLTEGALRKSGRPLALPLENDHRPGVGAWKTTAL